MTTKLLTFLLSKESRKFKVTDVKDLYGLVRLWGVLVRLRVVSPSRLLHGNVTRVVSSTRARDESTRQLL